MLLEKIGKNDIPMIRKNNLTAEAVETLFLEKSIAIVFLLNEKEQITGYYDVAHWDGKDLEKSLCIPPIFRNLSDINMTQEYTYPLFPIVDECGRIICAYKEISKESNQVGQQMFRLMEISKFGYNFKHYLAKSNCRGTKIAIYTDAYMVRPSLMLGQLLACCIPEIMFEGIYICDKFQKQIDEKTINLDCDITYVHSFMDVIDRHTDVVFFNVSDFLFPENILLFKKKKMRVRDVGRVLEVIVNKYFNDYSIIKYKHDFSVKGIKFLTMAVPVSKDLGERDGRNIPELLMKFLERHMGKDDARILNDARRTVVTGEVKEGEMRYYKNICSKHFNLIQKCRYVISQPENYKRTVFLIGPCVVGGFYENSAFV